MKYTTLGVVSYGFLLFSSLVGLIILYQQSAVLLLQLNWITNALEVTAVGLVALTWLVMGYYERSKTFLVAGILNLPSVLVYRLLTISTNGITQVSLAVAYVVVSFSVALALLSAGRTFSVGYLTGAGVLTIGFTVARVIYSGASYLVQQSTSFGQPPNALANSILNLYSAPSASSILGLLPVLIPLLAIAGFMKFPRYQEDDAIANVSPPLTAGPK